MIAKVALFPIFLPFLIIVKIVEFIVWELISDGHWKRQPTKGNSAALRWQNEALQGRVELRAQAARYRQRYQAQELEFRKKLSENSRA